MPRITRGSLGDLLTFACTRRCALLRETTRPELTVLCCMSCIAFQADLCCQECNEQLVRWTVKRVSARSHKISSLGRAMGQRGFDCQAVIGGWHQEGARNLLVLVVGCALSCSYHANRPKVLMYRKQLTAQGWRQVPAAQAAGPVMGTPCTAQHHAPHT